MHRWRALPDSRPTVHSCPTAAAGPRGKNGILCAVGYSFRNGLGCRLAPPGIESFFGDSALDIPRVSAIAPANEEAAYLPHATEVR
jgi:hypothetical protein